MGTIALSRFWHPSPPARESHYKSFFASGDSTSDARSISIVIPAFNEEGYIQPTLKSVFQAKQEYPGEVQVIVVDNNSTDATGEIAQQSGATVVFEPVNQIARARNAGAAAASGDYLIFIDADTTISGDILDKVNETLSSGKYIGGGAWVEPDSGWFPRLIFRYLINYPLSLKNVTIGPFLYCERAAFEKVGGFDETMYAAEEFSLADRLKKEGQKTNRTWNIIKHEKGHDIITSNRKFSKFGGLEMIGQNAHLLWKPHEKLRRKDHCAFWYKARKDDET